MTTIRVRWVSAVSKPTVSGSRARASASIRRVRKGGRKRPTVVCRNARVSVGCSSSCCVAWRNPAHLVGAGEVGGQPQASHESLLGRPRAARFYWKSSGTGVRRDTPGLRARSSMATSSGASRSRRAIRASRMAARTCSACDWRKGWRGAVGVSSMLAQLCHTGTDV